MKDDLISREAAIEALSRGEGCGHVCRNAIKRIPSAPAVPLVTLLKFIEQTEHFTYPPCQNEIEKCRDCKLHYTFGSQKECWKQFLTKWMEEQGAAD